MRMRTEVLVCFAMRTHRRKIGQKRRNTTIWNSITFLTSHILCFLIFGSQIVTDHHSLGIPAVQSKMAKENMAGKLT